MQIVPRLTFSKIMRTNGVLVSASFTPMADFFVMTSHFPHDDSEMSHANLRFVEIYTLPQSDCTSFLGYENGDGKIFESEERLRRKLLGENFE